MRMMGRESVEYHLDTVLGRGDDHPGMTLAYYASRGETPLEWGGSGATRLGLRGAVTAEDYAAIFGVGGARDPLLGTSLVSTRRPGMELVIAAHKSVAELGVMGRAEVMHELMDAERDATLAYLDQVTRERGARRGRDQTPEPTAGMTYAVTRHATSRAGDPAPHDHVLVANVVEVLDDQGGWKAANTNVWRDELHAATVLGRAAAARAAVEAGYAIEPDPGVSGRLGHWRIAGVPVEVMAAHSKRAAEIQAAVQATGHDSYQARGIAARETRRAKRHTPVDELLPLWQAEAAAVGWRIADMVLAVDEVARTARHVPSRLDAAATARLVNEVLGPDGELARRKVFTRADVIVAVVPKLYGRDRAEIDRVIGATMASVEMLPLLGASRGEGRVFTTASAVATEMAIAEVVARGCEPDTATPIPAAAITAAIREKEAVLRRPLTEAQRAAVEGIGRAGRRVSLIEGVAGAGKTTAVSAVRSAYEACGYRVIGTATAGQAARTLGREAGIGTSRTLASLLSRINAGTINLDSRTVVVLDEAGMTDDGDLLRVLTACEQAGAKVVMVGDDRQLGPVGPGGGLGGLLDRHRHLVHRLDENVRQHDLSERVALDHLRDGDVNNAVDWYLTRGRVVVSRRWDQAIETTAESFVRDAVAGRSVGMYAWRRANVAALNTVARELWSAAGQLSGPELTAPGGARYRAGDWIVTLASDNHSGIVTSERGVVTAVDPRTGLLEARMDDGRQQTFTPEATAADRLAHGYAVTVHRAQGATVDVAHRFEDGGGRELAYVAMSRARDHTTIHIVADDQAQAADDLRRTWAQEARPRWAIDTGTPGAHDPIDAETRPDVDAELRDALRARRLQVETAAIRAVIPPDHTRDLQGIDDELRRLERDHQDMRSGTGRWQDTPVGHALAELKEISHVREVARYQSIDPDASWLTRRRAAAQQRDLAPREQLARARHNELVAPHADEYYARRDELLHQRHPLVAAQQARAQWQRDHPDASLRLERIRHELERVIASPSHEPPTQGHPAPGLSRGLSRHLDHGPDHGLGL